MEIQNLKVLLKETCLREMKEKVVEFNHLSVCSFRYTTGVAALEISNRRGKITMLPFQGQQVWDAEFNGRRLTMHSPVKEPNPNRDFLMNLGGFLFHCGMSAMGSPGPEDSHPIHGELVNAPYCSAFIDAGEDDKGKFIGIGGEYEHAAAFGHHYLAQPYIRLYENESVIHGSMQVKNLKKTSMEYMYLAHINFLPVDNGRFVYTAKYDPEHVKVRAKFPSFMTPTEKLRNFVGELAEHPELHHEIKPEFTFDPEIVFMIDYQADEKGWAHAMHVHPDGTADYVAHKPSQLDKGIRWICRTPDQEALGMEAGTAGTEGYTAEKKKGNVKELGPGEVFFCEFTAGLLERKEAELIEASIRALNKTKGKKE